MSVATKEDPLNLLAFDGGGVRGISSLLIIHEIMERIKERDNLAVTPKPCEYFHLIAGTSTGGLIAIMLGRLRMSTEEAIKEYDAFAGKIFSVKNRKPLRPFSQRFKAKPLERIVQDLVARQGKGDLMRDTTNSSNSTGKAFVCAMSSKAQGIPRRFRSCPGENDIYKSCKIWEAARATTAAPTYFKPITLSSASGAEDFIDAAMGCNNPTEQLLQEAGEVFDSRRRLGCVVSIGTGTRTIALESSRGVLWLAHLVTTLKNLTTDTQRTADTVAHTFERFPGTYFRLNVPNVAQSVGLAAWEKMGQLKIATTEYLEHEAKKDVETVTDILAAKKTSGLTIGHVASLDKEQIILDNIVAQDKGNPSQFFTGRKEILSRLEAIFDPANSSSPGRIEAALVGMGGVGKTQIALMLLQIFAKAKKFHHTFWIDATNAVTIEQSYQKIATSILGRDGEDRKALEDSLRWLERTADTWLLVFDNCGDERPQRYIPDSPTGNFLYTSRRQDLKQKIPEERVIVVKEMVMTEAVDLLLDTAGMDKSFPNVREEAGRVAKLLGRLPLALDQAGAYVRMTGCSFDGYVEKFEKRKVELLQSPRYLGADERNPAVYATFDISRDALEAYAKMKSNLPKAQDARLALKILSVICFYSNEGLMNQTFQFATQRRSVKNITEPLGAGDLSLEVLLTTEQGTHEWNPEPFENGVAMLESFSLVKREGWRRDISMHVLVHSWARHSLSENDKKSQSLAARAILFDSVILKGGIAVDKVYSRKALRHMVACNEHSAVTHDPRREMRYQNKLASVAEANCSLEVAVTARKAIVHLSESENGFDAMATISRALDLADTYQLSGRYGEAELEMLTALERLRSLFPNDPYPEDPGPRHLNPEHFDPNRLDLEHLESVVTYLRARMALAGIYLAQTRYDVCEGALQSIIELLGRIRGYEDQIQKPFLLAWANRQLEEVQSAQKTYSSWKHADFPKNDLQLAERLHQQNLDTYGLDDPRTRAAQEQLAAAYTQHRMFEDAEAAYTELYTQAYLMNGELDMATVRLAEKITDAISLQHRGIEAEFYFRQIWRNYEQLLGPQHPKTLRAMLSVGLELMGQARMEECLELLGKCDDLTLAALGPDHLQVQACRKAMALAREKMSDCTPSVQRDLRERSIANTLAVNPEFSIPDLPPIPGTDEPLDRDQVFELASPAGGISSLVSGPEDATSVPSQRATNQSSASGRLHPKALRDERAESSTSLGTWSTGNAVWLGHPR